MSKSKKPGITLVEFSIALAILSSTILIGVLVFSSILRLNGRSQSVRESQQAGRYIMEHIARDVRLTNSAVVSPDGSRITIDNPYLTGSTLQYRHQSQMVERRECRDTNKDEELVEGDECQAWGDVINNPLLRVVELEFVEMADAGRGSIRIAMSFEHGSEGTAETNPSYYRYELDSVVTLRQ